jgi:hypothetical protein
MLAKQQLDGRWSQSWRMWPMKLPEVIT